MLGAGALQPISNTSLHAGRRRHTQSQGKAEKRISVRLNKSVSLIPTNFSSHRYSQPAQTRHISQPRQETIPVLARRTAPKVTEVHTVPQVGTVYIQFY